MRRRAVITAGILIIGALIGIGIAKERSRRAVYGHIEVVRRDRVEETRTGNAVVSSKGMQTLRFAKSGTLEKISVRIGRSVKKGDELAVLANRAERMNVQSAKKKLAIARTAYKKVLEGSGNKEIAEAKVALDAAKKNVSTVTKTQEALTLVARKKLYSDDLTAVPLTTETTTVPNITGIYTSAEEGEYRITASQTTFTYDGLEKGTGPIDSNPRPLGARGLSIAFPEASHNSSDSWKVFIPNRNGVHYDSNVEAYQSALNTMNAAIKGAKDRVTIAEKNLNLKRATVRQGDIDEALANVVIAEAALDRALADFDMTVLHAPTSGVVSQIFIQPGALIDEKQDIVTLSDTSHHYLQATFSDTKGIVVGQVVHATFAVGGTDNATVTAIDRATNTVDMVLPDTNVVPIGTQAMVTIVTNVVPDALVLPASAITTNGAVSTVQLLDEDGNTTAHAVDVGLVGTNKMVEIKNGLRERDRVVVH